MKLFHRISAAALCVVLGIATLTGCGSSSKIDGTKTVVTVNDDKVQLGVVSFLAKYQQASTYAIYSQYFGGSQMFDTVEDSSTGSTYGDELKSSVLTQIEDLVLCRQHASDYSVALTDDEKAKIETIAQSYIDKNTEDVRAKVGASKDNVIELLELMTIKSDMMEPMAADVDTNVTQEESQQTTVSYVPIEMATDDDSSTTASTDSTGSTVTDPEEGMTTDEKNAYRLANAQKVLDAMNAESDVATADMSTVAQTVDSDYAAATGQFTTNNTTDTYLDSSIVDAVQGLTDGTMVDHVVTSSDNTKYYVIRLDKVNDEDKTTSKVTSIISQRKTDNYNQLISDWTSAAKITVDPEVYATLKITDSDPVTVQYDASSAADSTAASTADSTAASAAESTAASTADSTASSVASSTAS
jgi:hypothetical protein